MRIPVIKLCVFISMLLPACSRNDYDFVYDTGTFPETPINLEEINSEYNDYNSAYPYLDCYFDLCFSTNRKSQGQNFDIIYVPFNVSFDRKGGDLIQMDLTSELVQDHPIEITLSRLNTSADELGPSLVLPNKSGCSTDRIFGKEILPT